MFRKYLVITLLLAALALAACQTNQTGGDGSSPGATTNAEEWDITFETPIEWSECPFDPYEAQVECGFLTVPVDYKQPHADTLRLAFAVYKTRSPEPLADPVVFAFGMPFVSESNFLPYVFAELYRQRDLIILDPRGTGLSQPSMACPQMQTAWFDALPGGGLSPLDWEDAHTACRSNLEASANLDYYSLAAAAADLKALRIALDVTQWNLFGFENGAYLAYEQLRIDPDGVRSLTLDGVVPIYLDQPRQYAGASDVLKKFFTLCGDHEQCNETFPNLEQVFYDLVDDLGANPITLLARDLNSGRSSDVQVDGNFLLEIVLYTLSSSNFENIGHLPRMIYQVKNGNDDVLSRMVGEFLQSDYTYQGVATMVYCRRLPLYSEGQVSEALAALSPGLIEYFQETDAIDRLVCPVWKPLPAEAPKPVYASSVPILLVNGSWNWNQPQAGVDAFLKTAPDAQAAIFPMAGRYTFFTRGLMDCTQGMFMAFIDKPKEQVDKQCIPDEMDITWITMP